MPADEVAMFIDLENLRYSMLNSYGQEPHLESLVAKARKYGRPTVMRAYAYFGEHPQGLNRQLQVCGIEAINIPVKKYSVSRSGKEIERIKNAADMVLALDAITEAVEADASGKVKVFLLIAGDKDYIKLVTLLRHRFGQRVVVAGVPNSTASDLVEAAGEPGDPVEVKVVPPVDPHVIKTAIVAMVKAPKPMKYWSIKIIDQWVQTDRQKIPGIAREKRDAIHALIEEGVLERKELDLGKKGKVTETVLNEIKAKQLGYLS